MLRCVSSPATTPIGIPPKVFCSSLRRKSFPIVITGLAPGDLLPREMAGSWPGHDEKVGAN
jgi:hypothetical protein